MEEFFLGSDMYTLDDDQWLLSPLTFDQVEDLDYDDDDDDHDQWPLVDARTEPRLCSFSSNLLNKRKGTPTVTFDQMEDLDYDNEDDDDPDQWPLVDARNEPRLRRSSSSFNILNKRKAGSLVVPCTRELDDPRPRCESLSTEDVMRLAGMRMIQLSSSNFGSISMGLNKDLSFDPSLSGLSDREVRNVELAEYILSAADKIRNRQFDHASALLGLCNSLAPSDGNSVERVVHCFSKALRTKITKETATTSYDMTSNKEFVIDENQSIPDKTFMTFHQTVPFHQVQHIAATQAILDNVERATKIHVIDFQIRNGLEWITLLQALESRKDYPVEHLKITALVIGSGTSVQSTERTGEQLKSFVTSATKIPFSFRTVQISDLRDFRAGLFETDPDEALVVFSEFFFNKFTSRPVELDRVMREIKSMNPRVMVMIETEANHNSPCFSTHFVETLFHYSAFFDCLEACMSEHEPDRRVMESLIVAELVTNMLVAVGEERGMRSVKLDVWRSFFARFGMAEQELSDVLLYQVKLVTGKSPGWRSCTTNWDDGSLTIGWKGTPMTSVSVWKFVRTARLVSGPKDLVVEFV